MVAYIPRLEDEHEALREEPKAPLAKRRVVSEDPVIDAEGGWKDVPGFVDCNGWTTGGVRTPPNDGKWHGVPGHKDANGWETL